MKAKHHDPRCRLTATGSPICRTYCRRCSIKPPQRAVFLFANDPSAVTSTNVHRHEASPALLDLHLCSTEDESKGRLELTANVPGRPENAYALWTAYEALPHFMRGLEVALCGGNSRSVWLMNCAEQQVPWEAELDQDTPGRHISWESHRGLHSNSGSVLFEAISPCVSKITIQVQFESPSGCMGGRDIRALGCQLQYALDRFAALVNALSTPPASTAPAEEAFSECKHRANRPKTLAGSLKIQCS